MAYLSFECSRMGSVVISSLICFRSAAWVKSYEFVLMHLYIRGLYISKSRSTGVFEACFPGVSPPTLSFHHL